MENFAASSFPMNVKKSLIKRHPLELSQNNEDIYVRETAKSFGLGAAISYKMERNIFKNHTGRLPGQVSSHLAFDTLNANIDFDFVDKSYNNYEYVMPHILMEKELGI